MKNILDLYRHDTEQPRSRHYVHYRLDGRSTFSTEDFFQQASALAQALADHGIGSGDRVMLASGNRPEWHIADLAILDTGAADVPVYGTLTPEQIAYQAQDSGARIAIVENSEQMEKFLEVKDRCPDLELLIQIDDDGGTGVTSWDDMLTAGSLKKSEAAFWDRAKKIKPNDLMTLIYTSGTTGEPKGVMLTHDNLIQNVLASADRIPVTRQDLALEFLPLCHVLERMVGYIYMWRSTYRAYCSVYEVGDLVAAIRPTLFAGVPRFYEKVQQKIMSKVADASSTKRSLFLWALDIGREVSHRQIGGVPIGNFLEMRYKLADKMVLSKVREGLGGRLRYAISGGAELPMHVNEFFHALGLQIMEGYGLTETSPVIAVNGAGPGQLRLGTVGLPLENLDLKIEADGELCVRGPSVMKGYWNRPEDTAAVFDEDGYFHTGDIADIDDGGFVLIVDRKKDLIVSAGGKNIAPQPIESHIKKSPFIESVVMIGDGRPYIIALISPTFDEVERWAAEHEIEADDRGSLIRHPDIQQLFEDAVEKANASLARYEQIKKFHVLSEALSIESGHLTPTLKVKRRVVERDFGELIESMYAEGR